MQIGNCQVVYNEFKSSLTKTDITPAQAQILVHLHSAAAGECAVKNLVITGEVKRSSAEEKERLGGIYLRKSEDSKKTTIESLWPGISARLPEKFSEVVDKEGRPCFKDDGTAINAVAPSEMVIGGRTYTKDELEKLVASKVKVQEVPIDSAELQPA